MLHIVTGGAGFVGSHLVRALLGRGGSVIVLDNLVRGRREYLPSGLPAGRLSFVETDCADPQAFRASLAASLGSRQPAAIWHMAANSDIPAGVADPDIDLRDTFLTTFNALRLMKEFAVPDFHFASSSAIYGDFGEQEIREETAPYRPISNYGAMKLASEAQICASLEGFGSRASIFRFPNVVGSPATHGVIYDFVHKLRATPERLVVLGNGTQRKAYLHVSNLIDAMLFIADNGRDKINILNIGPVDTGVTVRFIAESVRDRVSPGAQIVYGTEERGWVGDVPRFRYSVKRLQELGWHPAMTSEMAVRQAIDEIAGDLGG